MTIVSRSKLKTNKEKRGPGRPKKEPTKVMRVPLSKVEAVKKIIKGLEVTIQTK